MTIKELYKLFLKNPVICTDTRKIKRGSIFFCLKGQNFNGNKFAKEAIKNGCKYSITDDPKSEFHPKIILVGNVLETLQKLATYHRKKLNIPIIGITGTNGKTTSKELINVILNSEKNCYATKGNLNNHIGVPLSILEINKTHNIAIIEMGANHLKEINFLCKIAQPTHGVITNIGVAHLEGFKDTQGIINTKNELYKYLNKTKGHIFLNNDDQLLVSLSKNISKTSYGTKGESKTSLINNTPFLDIKWNKTRIYSSLIGDYQYYNISLAICIGNYFKISRKNIKIALESYTPKNNRSQIIKNDKNTIILDAYNANPSSMQAMLESFNKQKYTNKLCILGDMLELGGSSQNEHLTIIQLCNKLELECFFVGKEFNNVLNTSFRSRLELEKYLQENPIKNKTVLLKGSRGIGLEKLVQFL
ncbi:MAG: UDP-N-acetylmuramoyl-tripeptide--D-alanyl-D-alanine ligase [Flavobacteriales bacterium]|nr:UDP-N-acetylmuramoyl-tripeptide--D-alanyl-D-alanine ligase [Flavobacteriales bacterium]|tara:strand:+ start:31915 stop:33171 length:1257 start_codon:yes stop_codon:yes gene_type:complete